MKTRCFPSLAAIMAIFVFLQISCEEKEDPAAREARRAARRESQKEEIKKELQAEAAATVAKQTAEARQKIEAELQKLKTERSNIEAALPNAQRTYERTNDRVERDRIDAQVAANTANAAAGKLFAKKEKEATKQDAYLQGQKFKKSVEAQSAAFIELNTLNIRLDEIKRQETILTKKLKSL